MSLMKTRRAPPGSSRSPFTRDSMPSVCPVPSSLPVIGIVTKSFSSIVSSCARGRGRPAATARETNGAISDNRSHHRLHRVHTDPHLANHPVALAVDVELAVAVDGQARVGPSLVRDRLTAGEVLFLAAASVICHLVDGEHRVVDAVPQERRSGGSHAIFLELGLVRRRLGRQHVFVVGVPHAARRDVAKTYLPRRAGKSCRCRRSRCRWRRRRSARDRTRSRDISASDRVGHLARRSASESCRRQAAARASGSALSTSWPSRSGQP